MLGAHAFGFWCFSGAGRLVLGVFGAIRDTSPNDRKHHPSSASKMKLPPLLLAVLFPLGQPLAHAAAPPVRPIYLGLTSEDHRRHRDCNGDAFATTPNVDGLAARGMIYTRAWSCAPVCAPSRTTLISGLYPTSTGG